MNRVQRLRSLADHAAKRSEDGARDVARARAQLAAEEGRLQELLEYRRQYDETARVSGPTHSFDLNNMHAFSGQLDDALRLQQQRIDAAAAELERRIEGWTEVRRHEQAMERLVGRFAGDEARQAARAEQRVADDDGLTRRRESEHRD